MNPSEMETFQQTDAPLRNGATLIEASAGTGKTFAISSLILRLVLEERIEISQILAVTFTVAATEELRDRVRRRLRSALDDLRRSKSDDEIVSNFLRGGNAAQGIADLDAAVQNFDEARIFTIHGFCQRLLREHAFESGALFDMEMLTDSKPILTEVARDFWRARFYTAPAILSRLALAMKKSPLQFTKLLETLRNHPDIRILPQADEEDCTALSSRIEAAFAQIIAEWKNHGKAIAEILTQDKNLSRNERTFRLDIVDEILRRLGELAADFESAPPEALSAIFELSTSSVEMKTKNNKTPPQHPFFELCEEFSALSRRYFDRLTHEFIEYARQELRLRKERMNVTTYDDLLLRVRNALRGKRGGSLAAMVREKYRAALIDEFQDTDPTQYEIFNTLFGGGGHHLYFIGDPKQAIYGFRGADVFTYIRASEDAARKFTLTTNWRSEKRLLDALNIVFSHCPPLGRGINYHDLAAPRKPRAGFAELTQEGRDARLRFRFLRQKGEKGFNKEDAEEEIYEAVAADIARLYAARPTLGTRPLGFGDMAVLVRKNDQAARMQEVLRNAGIKSALRTEESVFHTAEATGLALALDGMLEPGRGHFLNTALTSSLIGFDVDGVAALSENEPERRKILEEFLQCRDLWERCGFMSMFRRLCIARKARERLVRQPGGERALTNYLHLAELLHNAESERRLAPAALRDWLGDQIQSEETVEEHQLRLESDADSVLIATIHKSKGLEYPVVFCPFLWQSADLHKHAQTLFHDSDADGKLTLDLRGKDEAPGYDSAAGEYMDESMRMLYVALTRAQNLCYIYAGDIQKFEKSPLARMLGGTTPLATLETLAKKTDAIDVTVINDEEDRAVEAIAAGLGGGPELLTARFTGAIPQARMIASFSSLISKSSPWEGADRDENEIADPEPVEEVFDTLSRLEGGVRAGLFWHDLLQHLDFQAPKAIDPLVAKKLASHGIAAFHAETVAAQVRGILSAPLKDGLKLEQIPGAAKLAEVEFSHPLSLAGAEQLREVFTRHGGHAADFSADLGRLQFNPVAGFMRGFIDLLFQHEGRYYLVDWKSNWLGGRAEHYDPQALETVMKRHFYFLQSHLYTAATDLFLKRSVPGYDYDAHFGGVFYIFLRGVDPAHPGRGIWHDRPPRGLIGAMEEALKGGRR